MSEGGGGTSLQAQQVVKALGSDMDKKKLLLLGLNLLNKSLKFPTTVVRPQVKAQTSDQVTSQLAEKLKSHSLDLLKSDVTENSRKRKRDPSDDELSDSEKREKRKMMNRVSAQNARDRKKAYIEDLERKVALLEEKNKKLEVENAQLKEKTSTLSQEKEQLEERLSQPSDSEMFQALVKETLLQEHYAQGSAAPQRVSQQQRQFLRQWIFLQLFLTFSLNCWPSSVTLTQQSPALQQVPCLLDQDREEEEGENSAFLLRDSPWWGPSQSQWNPAKN